jgi:hypothetical protein
MGLKSIGSFMFSTCLRDYTLSFLIIFICIMMNSCTTKTTTVNSNKKQQHAISSHDQEALRHSLFMRLSADQSAIRRWEKSDAWVAYYQGQLYQAIEAFNEKPPPLNTSDYIALARIHLSLSESYGTLYEIQKHLLKEWIDAEQKRPRADLHRPWYQWVEYAMRQQAGQKPQTTFAEDMQAWQVIIDSPLTAEVPDEASTAYKRWFSFYQASLASNWSKANKKWKRLKLQHPMFKAKGKDEIPALPVYDIRVIPSVQKYHAAMAIQYSKSLESWGQLLHARALSLYGSHSQAYQVLKQLIAKPPMNASVDLLVLNASTQSNELQIQTLAYAAVEAHYLHLDKEKYQYLEMLDSFKYTLPKVLPSPKAKAKAKAKPNLEGKKQVSLNSNIASKTDASQRSNMTLVQQVWYYWARSYLEPKNKIPEDMVAKRRVFIQQTLDLVKNESKVEGGFQSVASLGIVERWLDQLYFRLAEASIRSDQRVYAFNILKSLEDLGASMRVQGRNRLNRLILIAFNQLKMNRYRVTSKYLNRIRKELPVIKSLIEMTSDLLSGKAFLYQEKVNAGQ